MSDLSIPKCPRCGATRVIAGSLDSARSRAGFLISELRRGFIITLSSPWIRLDREAWLCAECGLCWSTARDLGQVVRKVRLHGDDRLVSRVLPHDGKPPDLSEDGA
jgi:hypothetical protein